MTRFSAAAVILSWLAFFSSFPAIAQSDPSQCFPWQEFKKGTCVAKPSQAPPPLPAPDPASAVPPCVDGTRSLSGQCTCPINMHLEGGRCTADAAVAPATPAAISPPIPPPLPPPLPQQTRKADEPLACDGGSASSGQCVCPAGYTVMPPRGGGSGGTCVRTDASNCQGGELTVSGTCMCNGQVVMSGETYLLEYTNGKCVPKRCPVSTEMRNGKCTSVSAIAPASAPEPEPKAGPKETRDADEGERHHGCGRGMVRTHNGNCVVARRKMPIVTAPPGLNQYYRSYQFPGPSPSPTP